MDVVRVATWNVDLLTEDPGPRVRAVAERLAAACVDVALLQEVHPDFVPMIEMLSGLSAVAVAGDYRAGGAMAYNTVFTRLPAQARAAVPLPGPSGFSCARAAVTAPSGRLMEMYSTHLAWGVGAEGLRRHQLREVEAVAGDGICWGDGDEGVQVIGGDFNAVPDSGCVRYFTGLAEASDGSSTMWVDAWSAAGDASGCARLSGCTSCPENSLAGRTAQLVGIGAPELLPHRRIDYLMVRGYAYGRPGCPVRASMLGTGAPEPSDHFGVAADLWDPPRREPQPG